MTGFPSQRKRLLAFLGSALCFLGCGLYDTESPSTRSAPAAWARIQGQSIALELAITPQEQALGLAQRDTLPWGHGMLFLYESPEFHRFWMKDMRFDIDILWIREGRIVEISHNVRHRVGTTGDQVSPRELADQVLELPAGYASAQGLRPGHRVEVEIREDH